MQGFDSANKAYKQRTAQACIRNLQRASKNAKSAAMVKKDATTKAKRAVREVSFLVHQVPLCRTVS